MKIGIVGMGVVGNANATGFKLLEHIVVEHDIKFDTKIEDLTDTEVVFLCLPTPDLNGSCDTSAIETVIQELIKIDYQGIVCIRSTVEPGFTEQMINTYSKLTICCAPEFLRERAAEDDFINNHMLLAIGTADPYVFNKIVAVHGHLPKNVKQLSPTEAEMLKYFNNSYAALRITFANIFYELCKKLDCNYSTVKETYALTGKTKNIYLDANNSLRGYGGMCLPKDVSALAATLDKFELEFDLINSIDSDNSKFQRTIFTGMRG